MTKSASMIRDTTPSFIIVKFGDNEQALFNPVCSSVSLLGCIRRTCKCNDNVTVDLVDLQGEVKNLPTRQKEYASDFISSRETYVLVKVEKQGEKDPDKYTALLNDVDSTFPDLSVKLQNMSKPAAKKGANRWSTMSKKGLMVKSLAGVAGGGATSPTKSRSGKSGKRFNFGNSN